MPATPARSARRPRRWTSAIALAAALALAAGACAGTTDDPASTDDQGASSTDDPDELAVVIASFDLAVGADQRLLAGVFTPDQQLVAHGEVEFQLAHLGEQDTVESAPVEQTTTARYLPVPGSGHDGGEAGPTLQGGSDVQGVYAAQVDLGEPGTWGLRVVAQLDDGRTLEGSTPFLVAPESQTPMVGDEAPRTVNLTLDDVANGTATPVSLDSRAQDPDDDIPDPHLHETTVAAAIEAGRPLVVALSTPVYCASRFCGPLVEVISELAHDYDDRADFVMIEVWEDFEAQTLNEAAAAWIQTEAGGNEPWVFLVAPDGTVAARWDNVLDTAALQEHLDALPPLDGTTGA